MKLVIAEKDMLARDIARAMCGIEVGEKTRLPLSGNGYTICACSGHLLELVEPDDYDKKYALWTLADLPIHFDGWRKKPSGDFAARKLNTIAAALADAQEVICAGDPDDEGQLIVDEVLAYLGWDPADARVKRVFVNDNIAKNIQHAFDHLCPNAQCLDTGRGAYARQMADKAFGISETRLAALKLNAQVSVGRVQTPTLGMIVRRDEQLENHQARVFYELNVMCATDNAQGVIPFRFHPAKSLLAGEKHLFESDVLKDISHSAQNAKVCAEVRVSEKQENPPLPYSLTTLTTDMSRRFGLSATEVLDTTQALRDKYSAITYNRTDSNYLKAEHFDAAPIVGALAAKNVDNSWPVDYSLHSKAFDDASVSAHHAIIPQEVAVDTGQMTENERNIYTSVVERYLAQFLPPKRWLAASATFVLDGIEGEFSYAAQKLLDEGFTCYTRTTKPDAAEKEGSSSFLEAGSYEFSVDAAAIDEKATTPPKAYSEGTLIADMASISKYVSDPNIKAILKKKDEGKKGESGGIGTTATRPSIIEALKKRGFVEVKNKKIVSTARGRKFYHILPTDIKSADTTAAWWLLQEDVKAGNQDINAIQQSVVSVFLAHKDSAYEGLSLYDTVGSCPLCGAPVIHKGKVYTCQTNREQKQADGSYSHVEGCGFKILPYSGKEIPEQDAKDLLGKKKTKMMQGFKSAKSKKSYAMRLVLLPDGTLKREFPQTRSAPGAAGSKSKSRNSLKGW